MRRRKSRCISNAAAMRLAGASLVLTLVLTTIAGEEEGGLQGLQATLRRHALVLFTKPGCPYCRLARAVFHSLQYDFLEVDLSRQASLQAALSSLTGSRTVPQVFVYGRYVGGGAQVLEWFRNGHLFSRTVEDATEATTRSTPEDARHAALLNLIRTSENAIKWIGNKTTGSLNGLFNSKNQTSTDGTGQVHGAAYPLTEKKKQILSWLKDKVRMSSPSSLDPSATPNSHPQQSSEDSGESLVFAHRTKDKGFAWGPPRKKSSQDLSPTNSTRTGGLLASAGHRVQDLLSFLYLSTRALSDRGKRLIQAGLTRVFAKKDPYLMKQYAYESIEEQLEKMEKSNSSVRRMGDVAFACDDTMKPVCAVDVDKHYTIFQNECKMVLFNYRHGTNFSIYDKDVCMGLFANRPELFYQSPEVQSTPKKP